MIKHVRRVATALLLFLPTAARAVEYSADSVFHITPGHVKQGPPTTSKVNFSNGKVRVQPTGDLSYEIFDTAKPAGYLVIAGKKMIYAQGPNSARLSMIRYNIGPNPCTTPASLKQRVACTRLGTETINGRVTEKWQYILTDRRGKLPRTIWIDRSLNAVLKALQGDKLSYELINIRFGPQPASLFVLPAGYKSKQLPDMKPK
jgi:hypothetical protein